jgi:hypothetical protein
MVDSKICYQGWCLAHIPSPEENAEGLAAATLVILNEYGINGPVTYAVSDMTAVMPALVKLLKKSWCPCWAHVLNLMLGKIVEGPG